MQETSEQNPKIKPLFLRFDTGSNAAIFLFDFSRFIWYDFFIPEKEVVRCVKGCKEDDIPTS